VKVQGLRLPVEMVAVTGVFWEFTHEVCAKLSDEFALLIRRLLITVQIYDTSKQHKKKYSSCY